MSRRLDRGSRAEVPASPATKRGKPHKATDGGPMNVAPLRESLLETTRSALAEEDRQERAAAAERLAAAREQAETTVMRAQAEGKHTAEREGKRLRATALREAREATLRAQQALVDDLRRQAREAALRLRETVEYPALVDRLAEGAREQLGPEALLELDPEGTGGVRGRAGSRSVDYTLPVLVDRALDELGERVEELWR